MDESRGSLNIMDSVVKAEAEAAIAVRKTRTRIICIIATCPVISPHSQLSC